MERTGADNIMRWNVVSMQAGHPHDRVAEPRGRTRDSQRRCRAASQRTGRCDGRARPDRRFRRTCWIASRGSRRDLRLIVTDEPLSTETGKGTDFVVLLSGEPQGGIKMRHRAPDSEVSMFNDNERVPYRRSSFNRPFFNW